MPARRSFLHRLIAAVVDYLPVAGLMVLWLGVIAVGWISLDRSPLGMGSRPPPAPAQNQPPPRSRTAAIQRQSAASRPAPKPRPGSRTPPPGRGARAKAPAPAGQADKNRRSRRETNDTAKSAPPADTPKPAANRPRESASAHVARAQFTSGVTDHEPVDRVTGVFHSRHRPLRRLYYFTELRGLAGQRITYRWHHAGRVIAKVSFRIGGSDWRVYSSKRLTPSSTGRWTVVLTDDASGKILSRASIVYSVP